MCSAKKPGAPSSIPPPAPIPVADRLTDPKKGNPMAGSRAGKNSLTISRSVGATGPSGLGIGS